MGKILLIILKAICYLVLFFNIFILIVMITQPIGLSADKLDLKTPLTIIVCCIAFLIWRFNAEKEIRYERKNLKKIKQNVNLKTKENLSEKSIQTLVEFKELLSLGIITQEEFEKKKNELLN